MLHFLSEAVSPLSVGFFGIFVLVFSKNKFMRLAAGLLPCVFLLFFSTPFLSAQIQRSLANEFLPFEKIDSANVAVLLGGAVDSSSKIRAQLGPSGDRLLLTKQYYDAKWFDVVLVSGGSQARSDGDEMSEDRNFLIKMGVLEKDIFDENSSRTTTQNAVNTKTWLETNIAVDQNIYLITSALHMRRAMFEFCLQGIEVIPLVANVPSIAEHSKLRMLLPTAGYLRLNSIWFSEKLGRLYRQLRNTDKKC